MCGSIGHKVHIVKYELEREIDADKKFKEMIMNRSKTSQELMVGRSENMWCEESTNLFDSCLMKADMEELRRRKQAVSGNELAPPLPWMCRRQ